MKKIIILAVAAVLVVLISLPFLLNDGGTGTDEKVADIDLSGDLSQKVVPISEVRDSMDSDMKHAKENYTKIDVSTVSPYMTDKDEIMLFENRFPEAYKGITDPLEIIEEYKNISKKWFGTDIFTEENMNSENMVCVNAGETVNSSFARIPYAQLLTILKKEDGGDGWKGDQLPDLFYEIRTDEEYKLCQLDDCMAIEMLSKGVCWENSKEHFSILPEWNLETEKLYNLQDTSCNLDDRYQLLDKEISVREGIEFVENWMKTETPYEINDFYGMVVCEVEVLKLNEDAYAFCFYMTREHDGTPIVWAKNGHFTESELYEQDVVSVTMALSDDVDVLYGDSRECKTEITESVKEILPLRYALAILEDKVAENSKYKIEHIQLAYRLDGRTQNKEGRYAKLYWLIIATNENDETLNYFYCDAVSGKLTNEILS